MDPLSTIGKTLNKKNHPKRDAIHIAIVPVILDDGYFSPGIKVKLAPQGGGVVRPVTCYDEKGIGILDPYHEGRFKKGDVVWCFMHPNSTRGIRHDWSNPDVDEFKPACNKHELWLKNFADRYGMNFERMIRIARKPEVVGGEIQDWIIANAVDLHNRKELDKGDEDLFWSHLEKFTGDVFTKNTRNWKSGRARAENVK